MYLVSLDPGVTTGICIVKREDQPWNLMTDQFGPNAHHRKLLRHLALWNPDIIICEGFENRGNDAGLLNSVEYIGVVKAWAQGRCRLVVQSASTGKQFWQDERLDDFNMYSRGFRHANDAVRHYLYYRTFTLKDQSLLEGRSSGTITRRV